MRHTLGAAVCGDIKMMPEVVSSHLGELGVTPATPGTLQLLTSGQSFVCATAADAAQPSNASDRRVARRTNRT